MADRLGGTSRKLLGGMALAGGGVLALVAAATATTRIPVPPDPATTPACSSAWFASLEKNYVSAADSEGPGPDQGDAQWFAWFERRFELPGTAGLSKEQQCAEVQRNLENRTIVISPVGIVSL